MEKIYQPPASKPTLYAVVYRAAEGVPQTFDGIWGGTIAVYEDESEAEERVKRERESGTWGDFSEVIWDPDHPDYTGSEASNRNLVVEVDPVTFYPRKKS